MPRITELAFRTVRAVAEELEIPEDLMMSRCRRAEVVDARHLAIRLMYAQNVYPSRIAGFFGLSPRNIQYAVTVFDARIQTNRSLRNSYAKLARQLGENCEATAK